MYHNGEDKKDSGRDEKVARVDEAVAELGEQNAWRKKQYISDDAQIHVAQSVHIEGLRLKKIPQKIVHREGSESLAPNQLPGADD